MDGEGFISASLAIVGGRDPVKLRHSDHEDL